MRSYRQRKEWGLVHDDGGDSQLLVVSAEQALLLRLDRARDSVAAGLRVGDGFFESVGFLEPAQRRPRLQVLPHRHDLPLDPEPLAPELCHLVRDVVAHAHARALQLEL